jgi:hypothetical protein
MPTALVLLAEGAEEMETVIIVDVLRRVEVRDLFSKKKKGGGCIDRGMKLEHNTILSIIYYVLSTQHKISNFILSNFRT